MNLWPEARAWATANKNNSNGKPPGGSGKTRRSAFPDQGLSNLKYAPQASSIRYTQNVKSSPTTLNLFPDLPKAETKIIDDPNYRHQNGWNDRLASHVFFQPQNSAQWQRIFFEWLDRTLKHDGQADGQVNLARRRKAHLAARMGFLTLGRAGRRALGPGAHFICWLKPDSHQGDGREAAANEGI